MEFSQMKVVDGLDGGDETQLEGAADRADDEGEEVRSTDESCEEFGCEAEREGSTGSGQRQIRGSWD